MSSRQFLLFSWLGRSDSGSEDEAGYETDVTDVTDASEGELDDSAWLLADNDHPLEYYIRQWQKGDDEKDEEEDYSPGTKVLLDRIEEQWFH